MKTYMRAFVSHWKSARWRLKLAIRDPDWSSVLSAGPQALDLDTLFQIEGRLFRPSSLFGEGCSILMWIAFLTPRSNKLSSTVNTELHP